LAFIAFCDETLQLFGKLINHLPCWHLFILQGGRRASKLIITISSEHK
jgi:hypothetical protein